MMRLSMIKAVGKYSNPNIEIARHNSNILWITNADKTNPRTPDVNPNTMDARIVFEFVFIKDRLRHTRPNK